MHPYTMLGLAIAAEVVATLALKASDGMSRPGPTVLVVVGYGLAFWFLSRVLQHLPVGMVYATWTGLGVVAVALVGWWLFDERLGWLGAGAMAMIIAGVALLQVARNGAG